MNEILSYAICFFIIILGVTESVKRSLNGRNVTFALERVLYYISDIYYDFNNCFKD